MPCPSISLANGVLAPKSAADAKANDAPGQKMDFDTCDTDGDYRNNINRPSLDRATSQGSARSETPDIALKSAVQWKSG